MYLRKKHAKTELHFISSPFESISDVHRAVPLQRQIQVFLQLSQSTQRSKLLASSCYENQG